MKFKRIYSSGSSVTIWPQPLRRGLTFAGVVIGCFTSAHGGNIIVNNDEWTLSNVGFTQEGAANGTAFAHNAAGFLTGGSGSILIYSDDFGLTESSSQGALTGAGYAITQDPTLSTPFNAAFLSAHYQAIFLGGDSLSPAAISVLQSYVSSGGGVYVAAGTGQFGGSGPVGAATEAAQWNSFLNPFGLNLGTPYNGVVGTIPIVSAPPVLAGVNQLFFNSGNDVSALPGGSGQVIASSGSHGLIGVYSSSVPPTSSVPDTGSLALLAGSVTLLVFFRWKTGR